MSIYLDNIADRLVEISKDENKDYITGEKDLTLSKEDLLLKMIKYENGKSFINVLEVEHNILEGQQAIKWLEIKGKLYFRIPDWDRFMSKVNAFHVACGPY